jgi:prolyl oligopeptidase
MLLAVVPGTGDQNAMKKLVLFISLVSCALVVHACSGSKKAEADDEEAAVETPDGDEPALDYPETKRQEIVEEIHGQTVEDPYRWLEAEDEDAVQDWMNQQNDIARSYLSDLERHDPLEERFRELYYVETMSEPTRKGEFVFYSRKPADQEKAIYYWRKLESEDETVLLDPNKMSDDGSIAVKGIFPSHDGTTVAYKLSENNADASTLYVMDTVSGKKSEVDTIPNAKYAYPSWNPEGDGFYYTYLPKPKGVSVDERPGYSQVRFHELGTDPAKDEVIRPKTGDPKTFQGVWMSRNGNWLVHYISHGWDRDDVFYKNASREDGEWKELAVGTEHTYSVTMWDDQFYIKTDRDAPKKTLYKVAAAKAHDVDQWEVIVPEDEAVLEYVQVIGGHLVLTYLEKAANQMSVYTLEGKKVREVELPGLGASVGMSGDPRYDEAFYSFQSFTQPRQIYQTSIEEGGSELWASVEVPVDPSPYEVDQVTYESKDGTEVTMFLVHRKDIELDGDNPTLLYGYGGFNISMRPYFRASIYPWLEAGGVYAVPNLRGGGEYGEEWHEAGMLENKQNVFDDFIAAAEFLIAEGYTTPARLGIYGGSNGGLLVGAVMTQRPELYGAVVCAVPLLDMLRYHLFGSGKTWMLEYGDPDNPEHFRWLAEYSPYHHVEDDTDYPALLMLSADSDDRVDPMHARKFVAAVQHATNSGEPVLLRVEQNAGHGGGNMVKKTVSEQADLYAFLFDELAGEVEGE